MDGIARAVFIIDGNYTRKGFAHLAEHGIEGRFYSMDFVALSDYVASVVEVQTGLRCVFAEKKVYMGSNAQLDSLNQAYYRALDEARFSRSTFTLRSPDGQSAYPTLKEDAVDTTIAFEVAKNFYSVPRDDRFNTLVLYAGDGDLVPVVRGLRSEGVRVLVIYYDFKTATSTTRASQALLEEADKVVSISSLLDERVSKQIKAIFREEEAPSIAEPTRPCREMELAAAPVEGPMGTLSRQLLEDGVANCRQDQDGWVLGAQLGKELEGILGHKLPIKLRPELEKYPTVFETKDSPAFSVRLRNDAPQSNGRIRVRLIKKTGGDAKC